MSIRKTLSDSWLQTVETVRDVHLSPLTESSLRTAFGFAQGLEPVVPMLELSMIVSLTYDERQSYVARFCNSRPIKWLGEISMSFYMCHMVNPHTTRRLFILLLMREILERPLLFVHVTV